MTKKNTFLIVLVLLLGGLSLYLNRDWFETSPIQISSRSIQPRGWLARRTRNWPAKPVVFLLSQPLRLTSVEVIPLSETKTNQSPQPVWQLTSDSGSVPVKDFIYGINVRRMKPFVKGVRAQPLQPGVKYRVLVQAGSRKAEHDFVAVPRTR